MPYVFMSFASAHHGRNIGCCIVSVKKPEDANDECKENGSIVDFILANWGEGNRFGKLWL